MIFADIAPITLSLFALAATQKQHVETLLPAFAAGISPKLLRWLGWGTLALSLIAQLGRTSPFVAILTWIGLIAVIGTLLTLGRTYLRRGVMIAVVGLVVILGTAQMAFG